MGVKSTMHENQDVVIMLIDIEKAFDIIRWGYIRVVMHLMGFMRITVLFVYCMKNPLVHGTVYFGKARLSHSCHSM